MYQGKFDNKRKKPDSNVRELLSQRNSEPEKKKVAPAPAPAPDVAAVTLPVLRRGDRSDAVRGAMVVLRDGGWYTLPLAAGDKTFGPEMEAAVKRLQQAKKLTADGIVGKDTWPAPLGL